MSRAELLANSGLTDAQLAQLDEFGLVRARPGTSDYDNDALTVATTVASLATHGLEPRHLRMFKTAADREVGLVDQVVAPVARSRDDATSERAQRLRDELTALVVDLHTALVAAAMKSHP